MSIEDLANIPVTTVTRSAEPLSDAPAAVYVITHDDIIRSGATSLPEMLRLAPNLQVAQINNYAYAISARGFNLFSSNKLLVLIDGRPVYSPYFNGVFWDTQAVLPEDVDRIEVISGPGATLWSPNAVNGVINIVTRDSRDTQGGTATAGGGNREVRGSLEYGSLVLPDLTDRIYGVGFDYLHNETATGLAARDDWHKEQGGFRFDWTPGPDQVMVEGNIYNGSEQQSGAPNMPFQGENLTARWNHPLSDGASMQLLSFFSSDNRFASGVGDQLTTYGIGFQHNWNWGTRNSFVWGIDELMWRDYFGNAPLTSAPVVLFFSPEHRVINVIDAYLQDTIALTDRLKLIAGIKLENESPYTGIEPLPSLRLSYKPDATNLFWAAVSRAERDPSREDRDLYGVVGGATLFLAGNDFQPEKLTAFEFGHRGQPTANFSYSISTYYNIYTDLRSEVLSPGGTLPVVFANDMYGNSYGIEAWGTYQVLPWWRLSSGFFWQHENLSFKNPTTAALTGPGSAGDNPAQQFKLRSSMDLTNQVTLDLDLREVGQLPAPHVGGYIELGGRLAWKPVSRLELSLRAENLLHNKHVEFVSASFPIPVEIGRTFFAQAKWNF